MLTITLLANICARHILQLAPAWNTPIRLIITMGDVDEAKCITATASEPSWTGPPVIFRIPWDDYFALPQKFTTFLPEEIDLFAQRLTATVVTQH